MSKEIKKKRRLKKWVYNALFIIGGAVIGEVVAMLTKSISFLSWLSFEVPLGITSPIELDLILFKFQLGFYFVLCPALVLFIALALIVGNLMLMDHSGSQDSSKKTEDSSRDTSIAKVTFGDPVGEESAPENAPDDDHDDR